ncbi:peptidase C58 [Bradyrhizobium sp. Leo170]|nr:peptidase C58 [Bradyrhizobium sp. Leo121]TAI61238.1 peptidase C58 [Bradyrhizobium sp. Leo170]
MDNRISGSSTRASQADEPRQSVDSDSFTETLAGLPSRAAPDPHAGLSLAPTQPYSLVSQPRIVELETSSFAWELPDKMGLCASKPHTSDADFHSSTSSSSTTSPPPRPLFEYRTVELPQANVDGICVGLTAEWLRNLSSSPSARMDALIPESEGHHSAAERQQQYQDLKDRLRSEGAGASQADLEAQNTILREAGLAPSGRENKYGFGEPSRFSRVLDKITGDGSKYLLSLYFAEGGAHTVATSASNGTTTLFDPNYGEFTVPSDQMGSLFQSLANRYRNPPNGRHLSTVTTQKMY